MYLKRPRDLSTRLNDQSLSSKNSQLRLRAQSVTLGVLSEVYTGWTMSTFSGIDYHSSTSVGDIWCFLFQDGPARSKPSCLYGVCTDLVRTQGLQRSSHFGRDDGHSSSRLSLESRLETKSCSTRWQEICRALRGYQLHYIKTRDFFVTVSQQFTEGSLPVTCPCLKSIRKSTGPPNIGTEVAYCDWTGFTTSKRSSWNSVVLK